MNIKNAFPKLSFFIVVVALLTFTCCKKQPNQNLVVDYQYNYYPIDSGHYVIYNVDSVTFYYDGINYNRDTVHYQMMAMFGDTIHDQFDSVNKLVTYYTRPDSNSTWGSAYISYDHRTTTNIQVVENDIRFIKLVFPPTASETWNGNLYVPNTGAYTTYANWTGYTYENIDTTMTINGNTYNKAIVVSENNNINQLTKNVRTEIYAPNVGMIYQEFESLSKQNGSLGGNITLGWDTGAAAGFSIHMWAIAHNP